jgi:tetratricopeptide (TPR) repeat protein
MRLFLSSTYQDLHEHRKRVIEAIDRLRHNGVDVEWFGMEAFGARDGLSTDACVKFVDECDLYVGFFGVRYGSLDPKSGKSMTEVEYRRAVEKNKSRLIFLIDEKNARIAPSDFEPSPEGQAKLRALKEDLKKDRVVDSFTSPEDLVSKFVTALTQHLPITNLQSLIPLAPVPYYAHSYPLQAHFTGRARERALLSDWLTRGEHLTAPILVIEAIGGMGKSALAWFWLHNDILPLNTEHWSLAGIFWWSFYEERDFGAFLSRALAYVSGGKIDPKTIASDRERVDALANALRQSRFLFVLDGFERVLRAYARMDAAYRGDAVDADARHQYLACADPNIGIFLRCLASGGTLSKMLITSRLLPHELDDLAGVTRLPLTGMDPDDAVEFFRKQGIKGTRAEIQAVCADYGFHPLSLRLLAGALAKDPRYHADIRYAPRVNPLAEDKERKILDLAYDSLPPDEQKFLSQLAAFRSPMKYETIAAIFAGGRGAIELRPYDGAFKTEDDLARALTDLQERGLCMRDAKTDTFDLHPVIRRYAYDRLADKPQAHARFRDYFAAFPAPQKIQTLADLQPTIELYHHTVRAGRYDEARELFRDRLNQATYYQLGAYQLRIELLRALFPDGEDRPPRLKDESAQAWTLNALANSYALAGQPRRAVPLFNQVITLKAKVKSDLAIGLENVAYIQSIIGELKAAEQNLRRENELGREIDDWMEIASSHKELGRVLAYRGLFAEAERELDTAFEMFGKQNAVQSQSVVSAYRALRALLMGDASAALAAAHQARAFAEETARTLYPHERDFIRAEWLMGAALVALARGGDVGAKVGAKHASPLHRLLHHSQQSEYPPTDASPLPAALREAEHHLREALARDRAIGLVELEAAILLEFARLRFVQADQGRKTKDEGHSSSVVRPSSSVELMQESFAFATEALEIAERCEYRLQQADIHNFLAEWWLATADEGRKTNDEGHSSFVVRPSSSVADAVAKAREHAARAKERAWCDGAPYHYKVAYERAEMLLQMIDERVETT